MFEVVPTVLQVVSTAPFILSDAPPLDRMLQSSSQPNGTLRVKRIAKVAGAYAEFIQQRGVPCLPYNIMVNFV